MIISVHGQEVQVKLLVLSFTNGPFELCELCASQVTVQAISARGGCIEMFEAFNTVSSSENTVHAIVMSNSQISVKVGCICVFKL